MSRRCRHRLLPIATCLLELERYMSTATTSISGLQSALTLLQSSVFSAAMKAVEAAVKAKFGNFDSDAVAIEDVLSTLAEVPGLSELGDVSAGIKLLMFIHEFAAPQPNGGLVGAILDSLDGVVRPVDNPSGAIGG
jgi:hypothetical protein